MVAQFLDAQVEAPKQQRERARRAADAQVQNMCAQCADTRLTEDFLQQLTYARRVQAVVEIHNHHIEQIGLGQLRRAVLAAAEWLRSHGVLSDRDDVFWLTFAEILAFLRESGAGLPEQAIRARKEAYQGWEQHEPPPHLGLPSPVLPPRPPDTDALTPVADQTAGRIRGVGASAGIVSGPARVLATWQAAPDIQPGDILVAENAGPLWLPFFPILAGIVLESGALGQHAASTAREYGLPAVISAANATQRIKDGARITIDGTQGIIELD
jgi:pyruvate,water dikinase